MIQNKELMSELEEVCIKIFKYGTYKGFIYDNMHFFLFDHIFYGGLKQYIFTFVNTNPSPSDQIIRCSFSVFEETINDDLDLKNIENVKFFIENDTDWVLSMTIENEKK